MYRSAVKALKTYIEMRGAAPARSAKTSAGDARRAILDSSSPLDPEHYRTAP